MAREGLGVGDTGHGAYWAVVAKLVGLALRELLIPWGDKHTVS